MTAFANQQGHADADGSAASWAWEVRSVNGRGLDIKARLPDGFDGLEAKVRAAVAAVATRGNITIGLRLAHDRSEGTLQIDPARLDVILDALDAIQERAFEKGVTLGQPTAADVLAQRGVLTVAAAVVGADLSVPVLADFETALTAMIDMRKAEGANILAVITNQVDQIETLTMQAKTAAVARTSAVKTQMAGALTRIMDNTAADPDRVAQELALIAVKSDITEEIDRLAAHVHAARDLLSAGGPVGRKLDFLSQEFNREANTLCSKAQDVDLTQIGLALKAVIDQLREQVQNVE